jgi:hypothetical protein
MSLRGNDNRESATTADARPTTASQNAQAAGASPPRTVECRADGARSGWVSVTSAIGYGSSGVGVA